MNLSETLSKDYIDSQYKQWKSDPNAVSRDWRFFFEGFEMADALDRKAETVCDEKQILKQARVETLIRRYREIGHLLACLDPLTACPTDHPLLSLGAFDLTSKDLDVLFYAKDLVGNRRVSLKDIIQALKETYCRSIGVEFMHLQDPEERKWLQKRMEPVRNKPDLKPGDKLRIMEKLYRSVLFEQFLHKKYLGQTRFSLEGAEVVIPMLDVFTDRAASHGCREIILGMAHRGRLNIQTHILSKSFEEIFSEFESCHDPEETFGAGDVKYHNGYLADVVTHKGVPLRFYMVSNPSHLESVSPVVQGFVRARQDILKDDARNSVLPLLIHGDAAFAGQGVVSETLNMSQLDGYKTGGSIHLVINNQIGYTTLPENARSTRYATDVAKMLMIPIFHVHGEDPEAVVHVVRMAVDYRETFNKDVVIDVICYRRYGHNEGDEPYFTQPRMYERIRRRPSLNTVYARKLIEQGIAGIEDIDVLEQNITRDMEDALEAVRTSVCVFPQSRFYENWKDFHGNYTRDPVKTGVPKKKLMALARRLNTFPSDFSPNKKLVRVMNKRFVCVEKGKDIDWANAEALAFASLLTEGRPVRLSGQDSARGTFSQRHSILFDTETGDEHTPLNSLDKDQAPFLVYNSMLSEAGVLGFEYGYSMAQPRGLVIWEAQFGDFANNAQSVIDLYLAGGQSKWQRLSGLVLLLPHGWEGLGPEHSSARLERFLQLCAQENIQVCNLTAPAQYFHLLRRQAKAKFRKPLIVMAPKSLLRHPSAVSDLKDMSSGGFKEVLEDPDPLTSVRRILFCSGKIYYELLQKRREIKKTDIAIVRMEQFYPFPENQFKTVVRKYKQVRQFIWVQEEPKNMGAWFFIRSHLENVIGKPLEYVGRNAAASPATGFPNIYRKEQAAVTEQALEMVVSGSK
ncbi:MAG: 2-oxoglutarate dehydrogenase E1 component [Deltaproteobacteria bacterium]|nr:2-oxoglutarate dehydrogenase E1 component [Deltaproteobacteria bacterium]